MWQTVKRRLIGDDPDSGLSSRRPRRASLELRLPNPYGGKPWVTATLALSSAPAARGETVRIRAHVDSCFHAPATPGDRAALGHEAADSGLRAGLTRYGRELAAGATRRVVEYVPAGLLQRLSEQRRRGWLDMQISTAPLDAGAAALMPAALRARYGDELPQSVVGAPRVGVWAGPAGGPLGGMARLAMVQFDDGDLDPTARRAPGERFSLNLTIGELIEPATADSDDDAS
ncbi:hypothetical protein [Salinisphaera sp. Q1T1-3]|uniref:hypothetical protein n=1 Tax=Salinisphaera sp. Q1T1-3 TaxID=2321229 RepID=UPI000E742586|nr:hypothetical protein [Salinisphaera sp. Q1T1-3]RJS92888.1 hypothetical protein D3260_10065 [Salinisphaera sp. Q1T1-3]